MTSQTRTITPVAAQVEDQLAMSFPGALHGVANIRPEAVFLSVWNVTDFVALVTREGGPRVDLRDPRLFGVPIDGTPDFRRGFAQLVVGGQPRFAFDFTDNIEAAWAETSPGALLVLDGAGVADERRVSLRGLPPRHVLEEIAASVSYWQGEPHDLSPEESQIAASILILAQLGLAIRDRLA